jgi:hypothetical protein
MRIRRDTIRIIQENKIVVEYREEGENYERQQPQANQDDFPLVQVCQLHTGRLFQHRKNFRLITPRARHFKRRTWWLPRPPMFSPGAFDRGITGGRWWKKHSIFVMPGRVLLLIAAPVREFLSPAGNRFPAASLGNFSADNPEKRVSFTHGA